MLHAIEKKLLDTFLIPIVVKKETDLIDAIAVKLKPLGLTDAQIHEVSTTVTSTTIAFLESLVK